MRRAALVALGVVALAASLGAETLLGEGFAAHMARHMGLVAVAAPLIALGLAGGAFDPTRAAPALFPAIPVSLVELAVVWGWHAPAAHALARENPWAYAAEQGSFLVAGLWLWFACFGDRAKEGLARAGQGAVAMLLTSIHMTLLGVLIASSVRPLFGGGHSHGGGLEDQQLGGVVMLGLGGAVYLAGGLALAARLLRGPEPGRSAAP